MSNLDTVIDNTKQFQGIQSIQSNDELMSMVQQLKSNPSQLQQYLQTQQDNVYKGITQQKDDAFKKVYGDLQSSFDTNEDIIMYTNRSQELNKMYDTLYNEKQKEVNDLQFNKDLAGRKYEMNQWTIGNKDDTLFVYSILFIILSIALVFSGLWKADIIGSGLLGAILGGLILVFVLILIYRSRYTNVLRNKRYWDRKIFKSEGGKIPLPNICPGLISGIQSDLNTLEQEATNKANQLQNAIDVSYNASVNAGKEIDVSLKQIV